MILPALFRLPDTRYLTAATTAPTCKNNMRRLEEVAKSEVRSLRPAPTRKIYDSTSQKEGGNLVFNVTGRH